jgi:phosphatidylglycerophosphatase A
MEGVRLRTALIWLAQGFGIGRIPFGPGTLGSLLGLVWFCGLLTLGNFWLCIAGMVCGFGLSVWVCGTAEEILQQKDPPSIVLDEIVAMPLCFAGWITLLWFQHGTMPEAEYFLNASTWPWTLAVFAAFRFFDVVKPWPVHQSQSLPGGWGVTLDDVLAAAYVNALVLSAAAFHYLPNAS